MKYFLIINTIIISLLSNTICPAQNEADKILTNVSEKLNGLESLKYTLKRELNYPTQNYHKTQEWVGFYDFKSTNNPLKFTYQVNFKNDARTYVYNGTEEFILDRNRKQIQLSEKAVYKKLGKKSFFYNSIITLKSALLILADDKEAKKVVTDTLINNVNYKVITVNLGKRRIQNQGTGFDIMKTKYDFIYRIIINSKTLLPYQVYQNANENGGYILTTFENIELNMDEPSESSWFYSSYIPEYRLQKKKDEIRILGVGEVAPDWTLINKKSKKQISLNSQTGKVVMIEFWIKNCSFCIASVPEINKLYDKFESKDFKFFGINAYDNEADIDSFIHRNNADYPILLNGKNVAEQYGINSYPTFLIIDRKGKIVLKQEGFSKNSISKMEKVIESEL